VPAVPQGLRAQEDYVSARVKKLGGKAPKKATAEDAQDVAEMLARGWTKRDIEGIRGAYDAEHGEGTNYFDMRFRDGRVLRVTVTS
jgi:hypothetical protein